MRLSFFIAAVLGFACPAPDDPPPEPDWSDVSVSPAGIAVRLSATIHGIPDPEFYEVTVTLWPPEPGDRPLKVFMVSMDETGEPSCAALWLAEGWLRVKCAGANGTAWD